MTSPQAITFLDLPDTIRRKIYNDAGLVHGHCVPIISGKYKASDRRWPFSRKFGATFSLLQTSKDINREVGILICAHNTLVLIHEDIDYGLAFVRRLSSAQCAALKSLSVHLYRTTPSVDSCREPISEARLVSWMSTAHHILSNTNKTLAVQLFCHTGANTITTAILEPFLEHPGRLKDLELELDCKHGPTSSELRTLARQIVCRSKGEDPSPGFPFFALPLEIRHHILTHTDLVTPSTEIYWNAKRGFRVLRVVRVCIALRHGFCEADDFSDGYHQACRFFSCVSNVSPSTGLRCCEWQQRNNHDRCSITGHVCCQSRTGYSSRCRCWTNPRSLLVANRQLYHEAIWVLYSYNRVVVVPSGDFRTSIGPIQNRLDAAVFITRHMWPEVLHHLRDLECVFPCIDPSCPDLARDPYSLDLCFAMDHLAAYACTSRLQVTVYLTTAGSVRMDDNTWFHRQLHNHDVATALRAHSHLSSALRSLVGIKDLFFKLEWGWRFHREQLDRRKVEDREEAFNAVLNNQIDMLELSLERMIMGGEYTPGYDRKLRRTPSVWLPQIYGGLEYSSWSKALQYQSSWYI